VEKKRWTDEDIEFLMQNFESMTTKELAEHLGTTESSVNNKLRRLKLKRNIRWDPDKIIDGIRDLRKRGESLLSSEVQKHHNQLYSAACRHFGNWSSAVEAAGLSYEEIRRGR
jgi:hypothetical protein